MQGREESTLQRCCCRSRLSDVYVDCFREREGKRDEGDGMMLFDAQQQSIRAGLGQLLAHQSLLHQSSMPAVYQGLFAVVEPAPQCHNALQLMRNLMLCVLC